jgi:hypothetical protein
VGGAKEEQNHEAEGGGGKKKLNDDGSMSTKTKETVAKAAPYYKPSGEELNDAISLVLKQEVRSR